MTGDAVIAGRLKRGGGADVVVGLGPVGGKFGLATDAKRNAWFDEGMVGRARLAALGGLLLLALDGLGLLFHGGGFAGQLELGAWRVVLHIVS